MADNLVNNVLDEMERNNPQLNYSSGGEGNPSMQGGGGGEPGYGYSPVQPQQQVRMGEVMYDNNSGQQQQQHAPTMQNNMQNNMSSEPMVDPRDDGGESMEAPDLSNYGMEDDEGGMVDQLMGEMKGPILVAVLVFIMSLPQVNSVVRNFVAGFTINTMYINAAMALSVGVAYFLLMKFLD